MTDLDSDARRILELAREARTPRDEDRTRVSRLLGGALALGGPSARAAMGGTATKMVGTTAALKWAGVALIAVAGGAGYAGLHGTLHSNAVDSPSSPPGAAAPARPATESSRANARPGGDPALLAPGRAVANEPLTAVSTRSAARPSDRSSASHGTLPEELDLLHEAQAKWRAGNASTALLLLAEHRRRFPRSQLGAEREALLVLSLCATNRVADARKMARHFLQSAQHSPLRTSVEESCGGK